MKTFALGMDSKLVKAAHPGKGSSVHLTLWITDDGILNLVQICKHVEVITIMYYGNVTNKQGS